MLSRDKGRVRSPPQLPRRLFIHLPIDLTCPATMIFYFRNGSCASSVLEARTPRWFRSQSGLSARQCIFTVIASEEHSRMGDAQAPVFTVNTGVCCAMFRLKARLSNCALRFGLGGKGQCINLSPYPNVAQHISATITHASCVRSSSCRELMPPVTRAYKCCSCICPDKNAETIPQGDAMKTSVPRSVIDCWR
jgi:hypothetical protein